MIFIEKLRACDDLDRKYKRDGCVCRHTHRGTHTAQNSATLTQAQPFENCPYTRFEFVAANKARRPSSRQLYGHFHIGEGSREERNAWSHPRRSSVLRSSSRPTNASHSVTCLVASLNIFFLGRPHLVDRTHTPTRASRPTSMRRRWRRQAK